MSKSQSTLNAMEGSISREKNEKPERSSFYEQKSFETYLQRCYEEANDEYISLNHHQLNQSVFSQDQLCKINGHDNRYQSNTCDCNLQVDKESGPHHPQERVKKCKTRNERRQFSESDDEKMLRLILQYGPKFQKIQRNFPGKTSSMLKNRYYKHLRYQWGDILGEQSSNSNIPLRVDVLKDSLNTLNLCQEAKSIMMNFLNLLA